MRITCQLVLALAAASVAHAGEPEAAASPWDRLHGEVNLRLRSELESFTDSTDRHRLRLRARLGAGYDLADGVDAGVRLSTGSDDPTSSQLTLGRGFDKQPLKLDRAFLRVRPGAWLTLMAGKLPAIFRDRRLIWDQDVAPEGLIERVTTTAPDARLRAHATLGQFVLVEREDSLHDVFALVAQIGGQVRFGRAELALDLAIHDYPNVTRVILEHGHGSNTVLVDGRLANEFRLADGLLELGVDLESIALAGYAELTHNLRAARDGTALAIGVEASWKRPGLAFDYEHRRVGRDAIVDALAESSWYQERTGFQGHKLGAKRRLSHDLTMATSIKVMWALAPPAARQVEWIVDLVWAP